MLRNKSPDHALKSAFEDLSDDVKNQFYWAVWVSIGARWEENGETKLKSKIHLLGQIENPVLSLRGKSLCEQMIHRIEMLELLEKQRRDVRVLTGTQLDEQYGRLQNLEKMKEVEDFDRISLLYRTMNGAQRRALLDKAPQKVSEWIGLFEASAYRKRQLVSDSRHLYAWRGAHPQIDGTRFQFYAPHARQVKLILTAYGKQTHCFDMVRNSYGLFEAHIDHAGCGRTYHYLIEDCHGNWNRHTDPFSFSVREAEGTVSSVVTDIDAYRWNDQQWMKDRACTQPWNRPLSIYEMHVDSWRRRDGRPLPFRDLAWAIIRYLEKVPFTHVQMYGLLDNKNDFSWGYQTDHFFAVNRRLGDADDFKYLVDILHQHGIGVIIDWTVAHYKHEHGGDRSQSLDAYDGTDIYGSKPSPWGTLFFDYSREETRRFMLANALYWCEKMHVDGIRADAVDALMGNEPSVNFLKELNHVLHEQYPGIVTIAEETSGSSHVTQPTFEGGLGFDMKLAVHQQWRIRNFFKTPYAERGHHMGKLISNLNEIQQNGRWMTAHSHDDAAAGAPNRHSTVYGSLPTLDTRQKFGDMCLFLVWNIFSPGDGGHAIHMGDPEGQKWPWNERLHAPEGAVEWHLLEGHPESRFHRGLQECAGDLIRFYRAHEAFWKQGSRFQVISWDPDTCVLGIRRISPAGERIALFYNFSLQGYTQYDFPLSHDDPDRHRIKEAREVFNTDGVQYGGAGQLGNTWAHFKRDANSMPTHYQFAFPAQSMVAFQETLH
jgi:1,4-alpha-glucan branching enzyme